MKHISVLFLIFSLFFSNTVLAQSKYHSSKQKTKIEEKKEKAFIYHGQESTQEAEDNTTVENFKAIKPYNLGILFYPKFH